MDPFSFASSVLAVVETTSKVTVTIARYVASVKDAEESRLRLFQEVSVIDGVLRAMKGLVDHLATEKSAESIKRVNGLVSIAEKGILSQCQETLEGILGWLDTNSKMKLGQRLLWPLKQEKKALEFLRKLERYKSIFTLALSVESLKTIESVYSTTSAIREEQERVRLEEASREQRKDRDEVLHWLESVDYGGRHQDVSKTRAVETCTWLFDNDAFQLWRSSDSGSLWLHGIPGSGKTILSSAVVNEMQQFATDQLALVYFYCNFGDLESRKPATVLCTLVAEFIRAGWTEEIGGLMKMKQTKGPRAPSDLDELSGLLRKAIKFFKKSIIVVDALDECDDVESLLEHLVRLPHGGNVKLFLTSRKEQEIYELLKDVPYISLKDETNSLQSDMYKHISTELRKRRHLARLPAKLKQQIVDVLLTKADGMFRWVQCQIDLIQSRRTPKGVQEALENLPKDLFSTYERILSKVDAQGPDVARIVRTTLRWLVAALRPLKLTEINEAVTIKAGSVSLDEDLGVFSEADIIEICSSLVNYDESKGVVSLSHFTVQEYLTSEDLETTPFDGYSISIPRTHNWLTVQTLTYLLLDDFDEDPCRDLRSYIERTEEHPLYEYAASNWFNHLSLVEDEDEEIFELFKALLQNIFNKNKRINFRQAEYMTQGFVPRNDETVSAFVDVTPLCYPVMHKHLWVIRRMAREDAEVVNTKLLGWGPPLMLAVWRNHLHVVELLLDLGADVNRTTFDFGMPPDGERNALYVAAELGHEEILTLLLQRGADINVKLAPRDETILHSACALGAPDPIRQLLSRGADVEVKRENDITAIHYAVLARSLDGVRLLVEAGCNVRAVTSAGKTALSIAMDLRDPSIIQYLLDHGADISDMQDVPINQLGWATSYPWYPKAVELLESRARAAAAHPTYSALDVLKVEFILCHWLSLPSGVAKTILDYAQCWIFKKAFVQYSKPFVVYDRTPHIPSIVLTIPGRGGSSVRKAVFTTYSHDQGFSDTPREHGTYRWTYSWFEAGIFRQGTEIGSRRRIQNNVHASFTRRVHINVLQSQHAETYEWLKLLVAGDDLVVFARAQFPGWANWVEYVQVDMFLAL